MIGRGLYRYVVLVAGAVLAHVSSEVGAAPESGARCSVGAEVKVQRPEWCWCVVAVDSLTVGCVLVVVFTEISHLQSSEWLKLLTCTRHCTPLLLL